MPEVVEGNGGEQRVAGKPLIPLSGVEVAGDKGGGLLVALKPARP